MRKLIYEDVKLEFEKADCQLISTEYKNSLTKLKYIAQCGHENNLNFNKFKMGGGRVCNICSKSIRYEYDYVYSYFKDNGCLLLEEKYINCKTPMKFIAKCGHEHSLSFDAIKNSDSTSYCPNCQHITHHTTKEVKELFKSRGCELLNEEYVTGEKLHYVAKCGHKNTIMLHKFLGGQGTECYRCSKPKGNRHFRYNPLLTDETRLGNRDIYEIIKWRNEVYKRGNYICCKCGYDKGNKLNAHHINGYNIDIENRFNVDNGVTLCKTCHDDFHHNYGYGNNTEIQFKKWFHGNTEVSL